MICDPKRGETEDVINEFKRTFDAGSTVHVDEAARLIRAARNDAIQAEKERDAALAREERLRVQLAGCSIAALGWSQGNHDAAPGTYGHSPAFDDVKELYAKYTAATRELEVIRGTMIDERDKWRQDVEMCEHLKRTKEVEKYMAYWEPCIMENERLRTRIAQLESELENASKKMNR
jgi:hypothetical protein